MTNVSSEVLNHLKLELLTIRACGPLCELFKQRYSLYNNGQVWVDSATFGANYLTSLKGKNKNLSLTSVQKTRVSSENPNQWDVTILTALLLFVDRPTTLNATEIQLLDEENKLLNQLREVRNKLAHHPTKSINNVEFNQLWNDLTIILVALGDNETEIDQLKDSNVCESTEQPINEENVKEALRFNSLGTAAHKEKKYSEAITFFTKATVLAGVSNHDRATFFSNMAASRLLLSEETSHFDISESIDEKDERFRALQDAKQARNLWPTWWKGHFRVGKVHACLKEHEKAITSFERALALNHTKTEIREALDESRIIFNRYTREQYTDPQSQWKPIPEMLNEKQQKLDIDADTIRNYYDLLGKLDPIQADVRKGFQYLLGDVNVKQDYDQAAKYFAKAANQGNAEAMYNLARLYDYGLGVKKDHQIALKLLQQAAAQSPYNLINKNLPNVGVAEAEHAIGVRYFEGISVEKDLGMAFYWFQRAADHGSALAANNLGCMYLDGLAVNKDLEKAEQFHELAAKRGDPVAMQTLAELLLSKSNVSMAKVWYDRACEAGNVVAKENRDSFMETAKKKQQFINQCPSNQLIENAVGKALYSFQMKISPSVVSEYSYLQNYKMLSDHANRGSITAKTMCNALGHFAQVLNILFDSETLIEEQENILVHELSQCYRIESIVAQIPSNMWTKVYELVKRVLDRCTKGSNSVDSQLDEDVRVCYTTLNMNSYQLVIDFLGPCKQKYPKSTILFLISGAVHGFLRQAAAGLFDINNGLQIEPDNYELLYHKAVLLRHIGKDMDEAIEAYKKFLRIAPKDHRKVPEVYYEMAICYMQGYTPDVGLNEAKNLYEKGKEAEKLQLPCFLPYHSENIAFIRPFLDMEFLETMGSVPVNNRKQHLNDSHRAEVITKHRQWESTELQKNYNGKCAVISTTLKPRVKQQTSKSLIGLKPITLREMSPGKDLVYKGYVLSVTIIEQTCSWNPSIHLVIEDENFDCERMLIYGFPEGQGEYLINKVYTIGNKMHIINPYLRLGADGKPAIRVDELSSIVMLSDSERIVNMCRYCCEANATKLCAKCQQANYCSKECQINDWKLYKHKLICKAK